jgi:Domain of unknown function (DUF4411)
VKGESARSLLARYCLDTSFFIDLWSDEGAFSRGVFVGIWDALEEGVANCSIIAPSVVRDELRDTTDADQKAWVSGHSSVFVPLDLTQVSALTEIVRKFPGYANEARNLADPAVIALAKVDGLTVLSSENWVTQVGKNPKMPNVCEAFGVKCLNVKAFCQAEAIELTRGATATTR